jgi:predicted permease
LSLHARLKPGKTVEEAKVELASLQDRLSPATEASGPKEFMRVAPAFHVGGKHSIWATMAVVLGASGLVLLIVCSNIANMLLARAASRQREIGVRLALGASRRRVIRQLLTESFLLAFSGGIAGLLLAWWSVELLLPWVFGRYSERDFARTSLSLYPDWRVLVFTMLLSLLSGLAFGLLPALRATRLDLPNLSVVIRDENAAFGGRIARSRLRNGLVVAQVALCFVLLIPAGLLLRGLSKVFGSPRGYAANKLLVVEYVLDDRIYDASRVQEFRQQLMARIAALPGVQSVCPQRDLNGLVKIILPDKQGPEKEGKNGNQFEQVPFQWVTAEYLETIGTPLILGRGFTADEVVAEAPVIVVSESTARNLWPGENPLGKTVRVEGRLRDGGVGAVMHAAQVIGVARDNQIYRDGHIPALFFYAPRTPPIEWPLNDQVVARAVGDAASMKESVRKEASAIGPVSQLSVGTMEGIIPASQSVKNARVASELATALGGLALALAALGLYGVMAFGVARRTREFGIRLALGAQARNVQMLVIAQGMRLVLIGVLVGVPVAMAVSQVMKSMLFGLSATDPTTYVGVALLLAMAGWMACWIPARRAAKVDPMVALRCE